MGDKKIHVKASRFFDRKGYYRKGGNVSGSKDVAIHAHTRIIK
jgi:hypothetical protein